MEQSSRISKPTKGQIECITRSIIVDQGRILLCKPAAKDFYFLPGGHIEFGEYSEATMRREILEELGVEASSVQQIGAVDNIYDDSEERLKRHEINLMYEVKLGSTELKMTETHISFAWISLQDIGKTKLLPTGIKEFVLKRFGI